MSDWRHPAVHRQAFPWIDAEIANQIGLRLRDFNADHVGVVIKDEDGKIRVFESTSLNGVSTIRWDDNFIKYKWYNCINRFIIASN